MPRGGARKGAGRPAGSGKFGEKSRAVRVPESLVEQVAVFAQRGGFRFPIYESKVAAGFPSPADDYLEGTLDLNEHLIENPNATFFVRVSGDSMTGAGIFPDDIMLVDRSLSPQSGNIIIAVLDGELTVKRLYKNGQVTELRAENPAYKPIRISGDMKLDAWGVVKHVIHSL
ncbi:MAG: LexA family protein [Planctomycetota bacterium]